MTAWDDHLRLGLKGGVLKLHGVYYPSVSAAIKALDWLAAHSHVVLGLDGIDTDGRDIFPRLDRIADFSRISESRGWHDRVEESIALSRRVLQGWLGDVQFVDLVVEEPGPEPGHSTVK